MSNYDAWKTRSDLDDWAAQQHEDAPKLFRPINLIACAASVEACAKAVAEAMALYQLFPDADVIVSAEVLMDRLNEDWRHFLARRWVSDYIVANSATRDDDGSRDQTGPPRRR
jgi:hypothetical protein